MYSIFSKIFLVSAKQVVPKQTLNTLRVWIEFESHLDLIVKKVKVIKNKNKKQKELKSCYKKLS